MSLKSIKKAVVEFINVNRQMGNTTIAIESALKHGAYFIINCQYQKQILKNKYPHLKIYTLSELENGRLMGADRGPIVIDPSVVFELCSYAEMTIDTPVNKPLSNQINVKISDEQLDSIKELNNEIFEGTASLSNVVRLLIIKGLKYYQEMI